VRSAIDDGDISDMVASFRASGQLQPIRVIERDGRYKVVAGFRRTAAARALGWSMIEAIVCDGDEAVLQVQQLEENCCRQNLTPVEEAEGVARLSDACGGDVDAMAARLGRSREWIQTRLDIAALPPDLLEALQQRVLTIGIALLLGRVEREDVRRSLTSTVVDNGATARQVRIWVDQSAALSTSHDAATIAFDTHVEQRGRQRLLIRCFLCEQEEDQCKCSYVPVCSTCCQSVIQAKQMNQPPSAVTSPTGVSAGG
jgi:ParB/RepB/Spo0J family partition protein